MNFIARRALLHEPEQTYDDQWTALWDQHCDDMYWQFYDKFMNEIGQNVVGELENLVLKLSLGESIVDEIQKLEIKDCDEPCDAGNEGDSGKSEVTFINTMIIYNFYSSLTCLSIKHCYVSNIPFKW